MTDQTGARILIVGAGGMLGHDLQRAFADRAITPLTRAELDITDAQACREAVVDHDVVINAAAYTAVDDAETHKEEAFAINAIGPENLARAAALHDAVLVQVSTDYVFAGDATEPYDEDAPLAPVSAYGRTKAEGERRARDAHPSGTVVLRTAWLYGEHGPNFVRTIERLAGERDRLTVVDDQRGQPTWSWDLARQTRALLEAGVRSGALHGTSSGDTTWFGFARELFRLHGWDPERIQPIGSDQFVRPAPRPAFSVLGHGRWRGVGVPPIRDWREALSEFLASTGTRT